MSQVIEEIGNYRILKSQPLGVGATGSVFYGQNKEGTKVAVKSIEIKKITKSIEKQIENQIKNLTTLSSPFIVKLYDYFRSGEHIYMVLQYCEDGDLKHYLEKNKKNQGLSEAEALTFMRHLMHGYSALSNKNIIHRDIKPANILLKQGVAKLSDFGFSRVVQDPTKTQKLTLLGTPLYTAPQILANQAFSNKCDVWSMGIVFYEMLHASTPWIGKDLKDLQHNIQTRKIEFKQNINPQIKQLISKMLILQPKQRATWEVLGQHPLFAKPINLSGKEQKTQMSFTQAKKVLIEYLRNYLVKSYLLLNMEAEVTFAPNEKPLGSTSKSEDEIEVELQAHQFILRRNVGFMHMYVLALYYRNIAIVPKEVNKSMQLEYALIFRTHDIIRKIDADFEANNKLSRPRWLNYKKTPQYAQLSQLLSNDLKLMTLLKNGCDSEIKDKIKSKKLPPVTQNFLKQFEQKFDKTFEQALVYNKQILLSSKKGVCRLLADYIGVQLLTTAKLLENTQLDFSSFYERRERDFGLD